MLDWADKFDKDNLYLTQRQQIRKVMEQPDSNWMRLINSLWTDIDSEVRKVFFRNFIVNASLLGSRKQVANREKYGCNIPWAILMDPTSACNLHCTGCWAAEYGNKLNLSYEELDDIINQANELGTYMFLYTGGEPMVRKNDLLRLCEAHPDCVFSAFTNGTLIDEKFADEMLRVKNFYPAISIEGFEEATDFRRGKGTYQATMRAMKILKEKKLPFGVSGCYTSKNIDSISSDEFFDHLVECGAKFAWFFHYMPVGNDSAVELLPSPDQREKMYNRICEINLLVREQFDEISPMADYFVIMTGGSDRQVQAITNAIVEKAHEENVKIGSVEGKNHAQWVLVDLGDVVVHVFREETRQFYNLEKLWADAPLVNINDWIND